ncbi:MAG: hypothetical protein GX410_04920 [Elusimicrobia bacterium]|nr:hypothetical protein [Elusimicrobiota bacterium]
MAEQKGKQPEPEATKTYNPDDPYGVKAVLEEKEKQYREAVKKPKAPSAVRWLLIFAPMYLLVAMPFAIWFKNAYEKTDVQLSGAQESAFMADDKVDYTKDDSSSTAVAVSTASAQSDETPLQTLFSTDMVTALNALFAQSDDKKVKEFFDDDSVAGRMQEALKAAGAWDTGDGFLKYISQNDEGKKLLSIFYEQRNNDKVADAGLRSKTFQRFAGSHAVKDMQTNYKKFVPAAAASPQLVAILFSAPVANVLANQESTAVFMKASSMAREKAAQMQTPAPAPKKTRRTRKS